MSNIVGNNSDVENMFVHHKFTFSWFDNGNCAKLVFSQVCGFLHMDFMFLNTYDARINKMEYCHPHENIPLFLYMHHTCFKHAKSLCKKHIPMKQLILCEFGMNYEAYKFVIWVGNVVANNVVAIQVVHLAIIKIQVVLWKLHHHSSIFLGFFAINNILFINIVNCRCWHVLLIGSSKQAIMF